MLGSNDAKIGMWNPFDFYNDYVELCKFMKDQVQKPRVYIVIPPPFYPQFGNPDLMPEVINEYLPHLTKWVAKECNVSSDHIIDLFEPLGGQSLKKPELYCDPKIQQIDQKCDGFHMNKNGY